jgi:hypothetical protein
MYEYGILKHVKVILRREREKRENNGGDKPNWGTLYVYVGMSQRNPLYNYYMLIKMTKKRKNPWTRLYHTAQ